MPRVPRDPEHAAKIGAYLGWVLPEYAGNFLAWWRERLRPEIERNFEYLDGIDYDAANMREMAVYLEDAIDIHDRHWKIHWMLNFAQFASTTNLNAVIAEVRGGEDPGLMGRLQSSLEDRNWDSIEDLWKLKDEIKADSELSRRLRGRDRRRRDAARSTGSDRGRRFVEERIVEHQKAFGYKSIWSHEFAFRTWREDPAPIIEAIRGYIATDYDYPSNIEAVRKDLEAAKVEVHGGRRRRRPGEAAGGARPVAGHEPAHPGPPLLHRPGDQRAAADRADRDRRASSPTRGVLDDAEDVMYLRYNELRLLMADQGAFDAKELVSDRRDYREDAAERRPPSWVGTATQTALDFPYNALWGFPEKFHAGEPSTTGEVKGLAASPGVVEGPARFVASLDEFDQVKDGEILVCRMTNPAWVVLFTKITGLVTEAGGAVSPPGGRGARVRDPGGGRHDERRRADQDRRPDPRQRLDGRGRDPDADGAGVDGARPPSRRRSRCAPSAATRRRCSRAGRSWGSS